MSTFDNDLALLRLQFEILNTPLEQISKDSGLPLALLEQEATSWTQLWPSRPFTTPVNEEDPDLPVDESEILALQSEQYIDATRKRLRVYSLAKEVLLAQRYLALECSIITNAQRLLDLEDTGAQGIRQLSALYKDLTSGSNLSALAGISIGADESGIPTVILKDLSGRGK